MPANPTPDPSPALAAASKDLLYPSDSEAPFTPFHWPAGPADAKAALAANAPPPAGAKIEEVTPDAFFAELTGDPRFASLQQVLQKELPTLTILRVGEVKIAIYLLGQSPDKSWTGLKTTSVES